MPLLDLFHHRSLTLSLLALLLSLLTAGHVLGLSFSIRTVPPTNAFAIRTIVLCVVTATVAIRATFNLIRDVERGYSPQRCTLAVLILFFTFAILIWLALGLTNVVLNNQ